MIKKKRHAATETTTISTLLGRDTTIEGSLSFEETVRVDGHIVGKLLSQEGTVIIGENAVLDAEIKVAVAIIRGTVNGHIEAKQRIEMFPPAKVNGDICAPVVAIDAGAIFNGHCQMKSDSLSNVRPLKNESQDQAVAQQ